MNTQSIISHRMFVAALTHDEAATAKASSPNGQVTEGLKARSAPRVERHVKELSPHQLMFAIFRDGFQPSKA
jgi:hypothetical protein